MAKETILITGANGQLGNEWRKIALLNPAYNFLFATREELPIDDDDSVKNYFSSHSIDFCVNCAAYTAVDKAEMDKEQAYLINARAVGNLAMVCAQYNTLFIHISTDYVFDGTGAMPYNEHHAVNPVNLYGASKLQGELLALQNNPHSIIIRTSWVYSSFGNNFVKTMLRLMNEKESINVVNDQQGCPTYAKDLASAILHLIPQLRQPSWTVKKALLSPAIFNYSNKGNITWYEFALTIKELSNSKCEVNPIPSSQFPTPAKRPLYSVLDTAKIQQTFNLIIPDWKDGLERCLKILLER